MEKLEKTRQAEIRKMSDVRLQSKLAQAGISIEALEGMDRLAMLDKYAELVLAGKEPVSGKSAGAAAAVIGYDVEFEKQRLDFQRKQWETARTEREAERAAEKADREAEGSRKSAFRG